MEMQSKKSDIDIFDLPLWSAPFGKVLLEKVNYNPKIKNILDIGIGNGFPLLELAQRFGNNTSLYGVDIDNNACSTTKRKIKQFKIKNVQIYNYDVRNLNFEDDFFNLIVSNNGVNNVIENVDIAFKEISRVSKKNAEFIFTFNLYETYNEFYDIFNEILDKNKLYDEIKNVENHRRIKRRSVEYYEKLLSDNGFIINDIQKSFFSMSFSDENAFFEHYFIKKYFLPEWKMLIRENKQKTIFEQLKNELHIKSINKFLNFDVPFVCISSKRI